MKVFWLPRAIRDRDAQLDYIAEDNPAAAVDQGDRIERHLSLLPGQPDLGRPGRRRGTRELIIPRTPFVVVYRVKTTAKRIELLRVLHSRQQWP